MKFFLLSFQGRGYILTPCFYSDCNVLSFFIIFFYGFISSIKIISVFTMKYVLINKFSMTQDKQKHSINNLYIGYNNWNLKKT